eukprot:scaffold23310_cov16-Tisochrysis_lutea.AAC.1
MVADLAIDLMRGLIGVGMHDAAQPLARLLIDHAAQLSPLQLSALGICMAEVDMRRELPLLLARRCVDDEVDMGWVWGGVGDGVVKSWR